MLHISCQYRLRDNDFGVIKQRYFAIKVQSLFLCPRRKTLTGRSRFSCCFRRFLSCLVGRFEPKSRTALETIYRFESVALPRSSADECLAEDEIWNL